MFRSLFTECVSEYVSGHLCCVCVCVCVVHSPWADSSNGDLNSMAWGFISLLRFWKSWGWEKLLFHCFTTFDSLFTLFISKFSKEFPIMTKNKLQIYLQLFHCSLLIPIFREYGDWLQYNAYIIYKQYNLMNANEKYTKLLIDYFFINYN